MRCAVIYPGEVMSLLVMNLCAFGLSGLDLWGNFSAGSHHRRGWMVLFLYKVLWVVYALFTKQYLFIPVAIILAVVMMRNYTIRG